MIRFGEIKTKRLIIREFEEIDIKEVHEYASDSDVSKYVPWGPNTFKQTDEFAKMCKEYQHQKDRLDFELAVTKRDDGRLVGACGLHISDRKNREGWIGYVINKMYWGKGYGTEIAKTLLDIGFNQLKLHRIYATCDPGNLASERILQKIGMQKEGHLRKNMWSNSSWRDSLLYAILEDE